MLPSRQKENNDITDLEVGPSILATGPRPRSISNLVASLTRVGPKS